jgi:translation initiation factor 2D
MFKKDRDLSERSNSLLKNKEIRDLKANIVKQFIDVDDAILNELFHKKSSVSQTKLASRTIIYSVDNIPLIFDKEGRSNLYPTIFFLWKFPRALKTFIVHPPVSQFILNGAALMLPGLASHAGV